MNKTALITGASSGLGYELAHIHAQHGGNLVLVARRLHILNEVKIDLEKRHGVSVFVIAKDLSQPKAALEVYQLIKSMDIRIDYLINNAGFGLYGMFTETDWEKEDQMIQLNMATLTHFCKLFIPDMTDRGFGRILNIASTAAFQPGPLMSVYFATKAYVLHFSEALSNELRGTGIRVTASCPGPTATEFQQTAGLDASRMMKFVPLVKAKDVARRDYRRMISGKRVSIHGFANVIVIFLLRFSPRALVLAATRLIMAKS
jgi:short-subunit dehydrogenase